MLITKQNGQSKRLQYRIGIVGICLFFICLTAFGQEQVDHFDSLDFSIDISETNLKFLANVSNMLVFADGEFDDIKTFLFVGTVDSVTETIPKDKKTFATDVTDMMEEFITIENIEYTHEISIDGLSGYEIYAKGKRLETGSKVNVYMVVLFSGNLYHWLFGMTKDETGKSMEDLKKVIQTFKLK